MSTPPPYDDTPPAQEAGGVPTCFRHPERETYIRCQRCDRYVCPDCARDASVGVHCVECLREGNRDLPAQRSRMGGVVRSGGPIVTYALIALNVLGWLVNYATGRVLTTELSTAAGVSGAGWGISDGEVWRLLTGAFVHEDVWHIGVNMLALYFLGPALEQLLGRLRFVGLYLGSAFFSGVVVYCASYVNVPTIGASGAIFGLFGAVIMLRRYLRVDLTWIMVMLAINVVINIFYRDALSVSGHAGGLAAGLLFGAVLAHAPKDNRARWHAIGYAAVLGLAVIATAVRMFAFPAGLGLAPT